MGLPNGGFLLFVLVSSCLVILEARTHHSFDEIGGSHGRNFNDLMSAQPMTYSDKPVKPTFHFHKIRTKDNSSDRPYSFVLVLSAAHKTPQHHTDGSSETLPNSSVFDKIKNLNTIEKQYRFLKQWYDMLTRHAGTYMTGN